MSLALIPYGTLGDGKMGILVDPSTDTPLASVVEILASLPVVSSTDNFSGRAVYDLSANKAYVFSSDPTPQWIPLEGSLAKVGTTAPVTSPQPAQGDVYFNKTTGTMYVWDGLKWSLITVAWFQYQEWKASTKHAFSGTESLFHLGDVATASTPTELKGIITGNSHIDGQLNIYISGARIEHKDPYGSPSYQKIGYDLQFNDTFNAGPALSVSYYDTLGYVQNLRGFGAYYTSDPTQTDFLAGGSLLGMGETFVRIDNVVKIPGVDYTIISQDTTIASIEKSPITDTPPVGFTGFARIQFNRIHGLSTGFVFSIYGTTTGKTLQGTALSVYKVVDAETIDVAIKASLDPTTLDTSQTYFTYPAANNDTIRFAVAPGANHAIAIRSLAVLDDNANAAEVNTLGSVGTGLTLAGAKSGVALNMKSLIGGNRLNITSDRETVTIGAISSLRMENRINLGAPTYTIIGSESYIGVRNTIPVAIDLSGVPFGPQSTGRRIVIMDEGGLSDSQPITITGGISMIDGESGYVISKSFGSVTLVYDGYNWFITDEIK